MGEAKDCKGSFCDMRRAGKRSFKRRGGQEDIQTLRTAVRRLCLAPKNAPDDCSAPTADIVPPHDRTDLKETCCPLAAAGGDQRTIRSIDAALTFNDLSSQKLS